MGVSFLTRIALTICCLGITAQAEVTNNKPGQPAPAPEEAYNFIKGMHARCENFINSKGELGPWGQNLIRSIDRVGQDCFYNSDAFTTLCPGYKELTRERKQQFIATLWAYIAESELPPPGTPIPRKMVEEMKCNPSYAPSGGLGPQGYRNVGLMRLEDSYRQRRQAGRSPTFCGQGDVMSLDFQMQCSLSMFSDLHCSRKNSLFRGYWMSLREMRATDIESGHFSKFPGCRN